MQINKNCLEIIEKNQSIFSSPITTQGQDVVVEFKYLTRASKQRGLFSNLVAGYTNEGRTGYCWYGLGISDKHPMYPDVTEYNDPKYLCKGMETIVV